MEVTKKKTTDERLKEIAAEIRGGAKAEAYTAEIDKLLGTGMPARDRVAEEVFENRYRRGGGNEQGG